MLEETHVGAVDPPDGYVDFFGPGEPAAGAFRCSGCGYGVTVAGTLPRCPMCGGESWERWPWTRTGSSV